MNARKQRKRRIAADEAHSWARNLRLGNPYAKLVLSMLTIYVNGEGCCFVSIPSLAEDCELAIETVRKRLAWLEGIGAITRFPQWLDENGRRNSDGRGKRTTDETRLMLDADPDEIESRAGGDGTPEGDAEGVVSSPENTPVSPPPGGGLNPAGTLPAPPLGLYQPPSCVGGLTLEPEPEPEQPPYPPEGGRLPGEGDEGQEQAIADPEGWVEFKGAFEADGVPILRVSIAKQLFAALKWPEERKLVTTAAVGLLVWRSREKKPGVKPSAQTFLREPESWPGFARLAPPPPIPPYFVAEGTREHAACAVLDRILDRPVPASRFDVERGARGWWRRERPPDDLCGLAIFAEKPNEQWNAIERGSVPFAAWGERIHRWTGKFPESRRILTGGEHPLTYQGKTTMVKNSLLGLRVPCLYPPRKDGSIGPDAGTAERMEATS